MDGFGAAFRYKEFELNNQELDECFYLVCNTKGELEYQSWMQQISSQLGELFTFMTQKNEESQHSYSP